MNNDNPGWMNEPNLMEEIVEATMQDYIPSPDMEAIVRRDADIIIAVLRRRGLLTEQGLQILERDK